MSVVSARDLSVRIGDFQLLAPVGFTVVKGCALAVAGANGSGKTTLLRVLAGDVAPSSGEVRVCGSLPDERSATFREHVAALLNPPPPARNLTLIEYLTLVGASWGLPLAAAKRDASALLDRLGVAALRRRFPHELSSGQTQLFGLAVILIRPASVVLLDEPEQRLDPDRLTILASVLRELKERGKTLVFASHSMRLIDEVADDRLTLVEDTTDAAL